MATHSSILAWKIPWMEESGRLQSTGSQRVGYDWVTSLSLSFFFYFLSLSKENLSQKFRKAITKKIPKQELEFKNKRAEINLIKIIFSIDDTSKN